MSALDRFYDFTLNLPDAKLTSKAMSLCNIDRNVFNIYLTLQKGKNNPILNADLSNYTVTMTVVKPKTKEYVEKVGVIDGSNDRLLFELGETFNDQIGSYKGEIKVQNGDEVITSSSFAYTVTQSLISGLNAEIEANPDVEILRQLINEVKAAVGMTPEDPDSLLTDYQKKTDETLTTTDKTIVGAINELKTNSENIKGHTHANKIALDKITDEKITSWDSKAEGSHNHDAVYAKKSEIPVVDVTKQYVDTELGKKSPIHEHPYLPNTTKIPTKVSELTNDSKFTTEAYVKNEIANAQLGGQGGVDLSGYATKEDLKAKADKSELNNKVDKEVGKGLSTNDFTTAEKEKLEGLNNYTLPIASATVLGGVKVGAGLSVSNGVLSATGGGTADSVDWGNIQNKPSTFTPATHNHSYNDLTNKPTIPTVSNDLTNTLKTNYDSAYTHSQSTHAPSNAQKNSDITKGEIEAKLTGQITSHTHAVEIPKDALITTNIIGTSLTLTADKYQTTKMVSGTEIVLPSVANFTEIHLFFSTTTDMTLVLPNCKWQSQPTINAKKSYELIFTYTTEWLGGCVVYE